MYIKYSMIFAYILGIIFLYMMGRLLLKPMKIILKFVFNTVLGVMIILGVNYIGSKLFGFHIALNIFSAIVTGFLGIPGILLLVALKLIYAG